MDLIRPWQLLLFAVEFMGFKQLFEVAGPDELVEILVIEFL
jgi:hypothetical protein